MFYFFPGLQMLYRYLRMKYVPFPLQIILVSRFYKDLLNNT